MKNGDNKIITRIDHPAIIRLFKATRGQLGRKLQPPPGMVEVPKQPKRKIRKPS